jgi:hypothetical protein
MAKKQSSSDPVIQGEVSAVGFAAISTKGNRELSRRVSEAVQRAVLQANAEGISTGEENTPILRERMEAAREQARSDYFAERSRKNN